MLLDNEILPNVVERLPEFHRQSVNHRVIESCYNFTEILERSYEMFYNSAEPDVRIILIFAENPRDVHP